MSEFKLYTDPGYVRQLYLMLIKEFPAIVRTYVGMGLVKPTPSKPLTTLQAPRSFDEALEAALEEAEEEEFE